MEGVTVSHVLVTYATKYGSTGEVAERVGATLKGLGHAVDVTPAARVTDVAAYDAVVVGAPLYIGKILKDASAFFERHQAVLETKPVALFLLGPVKAEDDMAEARTQIAPVLERIGWLKPVATEMFVGKFDPATLRGLDKLVTKPKASPLYGVPARDDRDWNAIEAWAASLPGMLLPN